MTAPPDDLDAMAARYARRGAPERYSMLQPDVWQSVQERQRAMLGLFAQAGWTDLVDKRAARGRLRRRRQPAGAAAPGLRARAADRHRTAARARGAGAARAADGAAPDRRRCDARRRSVPGIQDSCSQSTVFTSLLDDATTQRPGRRDVALAGAGRRGAVVRLHRQQPAQPRRARRAAGASARAVPAGPHHGAARDAGAAAGACGVSRSTRALYPLLNAMPLLRTHVLAWVDQGRDTRGVGYDFEHDSINASLHQPILCEAFVRTTLDIDDDLLAAAKELRAPRKAAPPARSCRGCCGTRSPGGASTAAARSRRAGATAAPARWPASNRCPAEPGRGWTYATSRSTRLRDAERRVTGACLARRQRAGGAARRRRTCIIGVRRTGWRRMPGRAGRRAR